MNIGQLVPVPKDDGGALAPTTKEKLVVALVKWFAQKYGADIARSVFDKLSLDKLRELARREGLPGFGKKKKTTPTTTSGGAAILLLLLFAFARSKTRR